jgi:hypothetical protein
MSVDRDKILKQLAHVLNQIAEGRENIARQQKAVAELERNGQDASLAHKMLKYAEHVQTIHVAEQQRLEKLLGATIDGREKTEVRSG